MKRDEGFVASILRLNAAAVKRHGKASVCLTVLKVELAHSGGISWHQVISFERRYGDGGRDTADDLTMK